MYNFCHEKLQVLFCYSFCCQINIFGFTNRKAQWKRDTGNISIGTEIVIDTDYCDSTFGVKVNKMVRPFISTKFSHEILPISNQCIEKVGIEKVKGTDKTQCKLSFRQNTFL